MSKTKLYIMIANLLLVLGFFFFNIVKNERILNSGEIVLMRLRPVDPRSLMQGDYMELRYSIGDNIRNGTWQREQKSEYDEQHKYCVVRLDKDRVASFVRTTDDEEDLKDGEILLRYSKGKKVWESYVSFGADSYFFQEGTGAKYENAKYGMLKVQTTGSLIGTCRLVGLCGEDKQLIE